MGGLKILLPKRHKLKMILITQVQANNKKRSKLKPLKFYLSAVM